MSDRPRQPSGFALSWWARALVALAIAHIAGAVIMLVVEPQSATMGDSALDIWMVALQVITFSTAAAILLLAHARDERTANLGVSLLVIGSAFASSHFADFARRFPAFAATTTWYPDAFLAVFIGRFVRAFPHRRNGRADRFLGALIWYALITGAILFAANALRASALAHWSLVAALQRKSEGGTVYWTAIFMPIAVMLPMVFSGASAWRREERHRVRWFWGAFVSGFGPMVLLIVLGSLPAIGPRLMARATTGWTLPVVEVLLASVPLTVAYAVLVQRLLPLRVIVHRALQYVFARWAITALALVPAALLVARAYQHRHETIAAAMSGGITWFLIAGIVVSSAAVAGRSTVLLVIDRWFLREAYDARAVLIELSERARRAHGIDELVAVVTAGIDRALRPESTVVLVRGERGSHFISLFGAAEPLSTSSVLVEILAALDGAPVDVRVDDERSPLKWLPRQERQWLADNQSLLLVPLAASDGLVVGIISLGARKSELPYSAEDRRLLAAIADAAALTIENHAFRLSHERGRDAEEPDDVSPWWRIGAAPQHTQAKECPVCGSVQPAEDAVCRECQATLEKSGVPQVLFGKFQFERRVGRGGMGVVYRATDLMLERTVAIKTLPGTSPEYSRRLRLEAKAMAAVTHRNLATIHGAESWRGQPMLVCEFMEHGTLATRLAAGPLPVDRAIDLGLALAEALQVIHRAGLLHRDIKPSNIGYAAGGIPKLLDFGLAYMLSEADDRATRPVVGTPLYMSPEATAGHAPTQMFDLWSLNVLLLEAISGTHPFRGRTTEETTSLIREARRPRSLEALRGPFAKVADYFEDALAKELHRRPRSAAELAARLRAIAP